MLCYIALNVVKLITLKGDILSTNVVKVDLDKDGVLDYNQNKQLVFWVLKHTKNGNNPLWLNDSHVVINKQKNYKPFLKIGFL